MIGQGKSELERGEMGKKTETEGFHTMETCFGKSSTPWKMVLVTFPHHGSMFRRTFPRCGKISGGVLAASAGGLGALGEPGEVE